MNEDKASRYHRLKRYAAVASIIWVLALLVGLLASGLSLSLRNISARAAAASGPLAWQPTLTANWQATGGNRWLVPVGGGIGRITKLGFQPVNLTAQFYGNAVHPTGASPWGMRLQIAFLFPRLTKDQQKMMMQMKLKQMEQEEQGQKH